jgi:hypothetical protein
LGNIIITPSNDSTQRNLYKKNSLAGTLHLVQWATLVIKPFSERLVIKINSKIAGTIWTCMQVKSKRNKIL